MILIREDFEEVVVDIITEGEGDSAKKSMFIEGVFMQDTLKNRNGRVYPKEVMANSVQKYNENFIKTNRALGELNHPPQASVNPERASHMVVSLKENGNDWIGKAKILSTPMGSLVENLINDGVQLGVSSRGLGSVKESNKSNIVQNDFWISAIDVVSDPSAPNAFINGIMENKEWILENGVLVERDMEDVQKEVNELAKHNKLNTENLEALFNKVLINL